MLILLNANQICFDKAYSTKSHHLHNINLIECYSILIATEK